MLQSRQLTVRVSQLIRIFQLENASTYVVESYGELRDCINDLSHHTSLWFHSKAAIFEKLLPILCARKTKDEFICVCPEYTV